MPDTFLGQLTTDDRAIVLADASILSVRAGQAIFSVSDAVERIGILLDGIARTYLSAADGRRLTVRYARPGASIGGIAEGGRALHAQAVTDCVVLEIELATLRDRAAEHADVGIALLAEMSRRLDAVYATLATNTFGTMRERVAHHLLDLATETHAAGRLIAPVTQQTLADCVGTVREVVARVLREFRDEGLVATQPGHIELIDPDGVAAILGRRRSASAREERPVPVRRVTVRVTDRSRPV